MVALGGYAWLLPGGHAWLLQGACMVAPRGVACVVAPGGACMVAPGWACMVAPRGGMHGCSQGACMVALGGCVWDMMRYRDTINEQAVCILLECILVVSKVS